MKKTIIIVVGIIFVAVIAIVGYLFFKKDNIDLSIFDKKMDSDVEIDKKEYNVDDLHDEIDCTYKYNDYIVKWHNFEVGGADTNSIEIIKDNKILYKNEDVKTTILEDGKYDRGYYEDYAEVNPVIVDGKLYFLAFNDKACNERTEEESLYYLDLNSIDLTKDEIKVNSIKKYLLNVEGSVPDCEE